MIDLEAIQARCFEVLQEIPNHRFEFFPQGQRGQSVSDGEVFLFLHRLDIQHRDRIDELVSRLVLDGMTLEAPPLDWYLLKQRLCAAVFVLQRLRGTLLQEDYLCLSIADPDYAFEWALTLFWLFAAPVWMQHAAKLIAAGLPIDPSSSV
jgi:hypothetical protein